MSHKKHQCSFLILSYYSFLSFVETWRRKMVDVLEEDSLPLQLYIKDSLGGIENTTCLSYRIIVYL